MWLYVPSTISAYFPVSEGLILPSDSPCLPPDVWLTARGKPLQPQSLRRVWKTAHWMRRLSGLMSEPSQADYSVAVSAWLRAVSPVRTSAAQETGSALSKATDPASSLTSSEPLTTWDAITSSWRTSQASMFGPTLTLFSESWPRAGSLRNGSAYVRRTSAPRINANAGSVLHDGASAWPTPDAGQYGSTTASDGSRKPLLGQLASMWPTATADDADNVTRQSGEFMSLTLPASGWPTPNSGDSDKGQVNLPNSGQVHLSAVAAQWITPRTAEAEHAGPTSVLHSGQTGLSEQANTWATPTSRDHKDGACETADVPTNALLGRQAVREWQTPASDSFRSRGGDRKDEMGLDQQARFFPASRPDPPSTSNGHASSANIPTSRQRLNPRFVEWLMGLPIGWTNPDSSIELTGSEHSATASYLFRVRSLFENSGGAYTEVDA